MVKSMTELLISLVTITVLQMSNEYLTWLGEHAIFLWYATVYVMLGVLCSACREFYDSYIQSLHYV